MRLFSRRQAKTQAKILNDDNNNYPSNVKFAFNTKAHLVEKPQPYPPIKNGLVCTVVFLDGENVNFEVDRKALGRDLYDKVIIHTKLIESDYFGLQFTDTHNVEQWLDATKSIKKQRKTGPPYTFRFRVKFYTSDPRNLHEELTRYLFVLQLKDDIRTGKLDCPSGSDVELTALSMQAELGDYTSDEHSTNNVFEYRFLPDYKHTEQFEQDVIQKWTTYKGLTPADCEVQFLNKARWLEMYGVDLHTVTGKDCLEYKLGLTPTGILVFENEVKIGLFIWSKVTRIDFNRNKLTIIVIEDDDNDPRLQRDFVFLFRCNDEKECKHFWKCALEYHVFFRTTSATKLKKNAKSSFTRTGSRFRFSGRTECQTAALATLPNRNTNFERKASHRFSRRASYAIRKKLQEQETLREQEDERLKKLKCEQEAKFDENKKIAEFKSVTNSFLSNHDLTLTSKRSSSLSSSQKNLSLSATQRLDNLIQGSSNDLLFEETEANAKSANLPPTPPVPPRQIKSDDKTTPPLVLTKQSNPVNACSVNNNNVNTTNGLDLSQDLISNNHHIGNDQTIFIQKSPQKTPKSLTNGFHQRNVSRTDKMNSTSNRYTLASSHPAPYVVKEETSTDDLETNKTNSSSSNKISLFNKFPLFGVPITQSSHDDNNRAMYDNILHYCLNPLNDSNSIYAKFDFRHRSLTLRNQEEQFEKRCANYDNLSYLVIDGISSKKNSNRGNGKIASCLSIQSLGSTAPVIVTRTSSQSNFRNASSTLVQATNPTLSSSHFNPRHLSSSSVAGFPSNHSQSYHPITTEL
ncbi:unnamed protein product [Rotaria socialis]|uniref:FERM domain-containing protein n=1 Tax=Rotaria socialis TaxID=392032 RepID=A0A820V8F3_9BILA|nr:unnamed protein product [Rotaria socialis]